MNRTIALIALLCTTSHLFAQPTDPPNTAQEHLARRHPGAVVMEWKKGAKHYKAEFMVKEEEYMAQYTLDGEWVRTEHDVKKTELPAAVMTALRTSRYGKWKIQDTEEHATPSVPSVFKVKVEDETGSAEAELFFTPDGKLVREESRKK